MKVKWVPVEEKLPPDGGHYLGIERIVYPDREKGYYDEKIVSVRFDRRRGWLLNYEEDRLIYITHWSESPETPLFENAPE